MGLDQVVILREAMGEVVMFSEEELREMSGVKRGVDHIEVTCGCTSHRYGDAVGRLRVFMNGELEITCECTPGCQEGPSSLPCSTLFWRIIRAFLLCVMFLYACCSAVVCVFEIDEFF